MQQACMHAVYAYVQLQTIGHDRCSHHPKQEQAQPPAHSTTIATRSQLDMSIGNSHQMLSKPVVDNAHLSTRTMARTVEPTLTAPMMAVFSWVA